MYKKFLNDSCRQSASFAVRAQGADPPSGVRIYLAADNTCIETKPYILRIKCFGNHSKCGAVFGEAFIAVTCPFAALLMSLNHH